MSQHVTIPYPHPKPKRVSDVGTWCVTVKRGGYVETIVFGGDDAEEKARAFHTEAKALASA